MSTFNVIGKLLATACGVGRPQAYNNDVLNDSATVYIRPGASDAGRAAMGVG
jgi:predicted NodU family carbamoyl transferase